MTAQRMVTMRVANMVPDMQYNLQLSQQSLSTALQQVTTGLRVNQPSDDPAAAATMTISLASSANVDQYTKNISSITSQMQTADSSFSSIVTSLNNAITLGTSGAGSTVSTANKQAIATELQGVLSSVVAQANASYQGVYLFAGSASSTLPLVPASTTYTSEAGTVAAPLTTAYPLTAGSVTSPPARRLSLLQPPARPSPNFPLLLPMPRPLARSPPARPQPSMRLASWRSARIRARMASRSPQMILPSAQ
jgi:hypothetical protein